MLCEGCYSVIFVRAMTKISSQIVLLHQFTNLFDAFSLALQSSWRGVVFVECFDCPHLFIYFTKAVLFQLYCNNVWVTTASHSRTLYCTLPITGTEITELRHHARVQHQKEYVRRRCRTVRGEGAKRLIRHIFTAGSLWIIYEILCFSNEHIPVQFAGS